MKMDATNPGWCAVIMDVCYFRARNTERDAEIAELKAELAAKTDECERLKRSDPVLSELAGAIRAVCGLDMPEAEIVRDLAMKTKRLNDQLRKELAALRARADDAGRVERAARVIEGLPGWDADEALCLARLVLAAAEGRDE